MKNKAIFAASERNREEIRNSSLSSGTPVKDLRIEM